MEQKNKSGIIIGILIGVIIVLTALVILFATDTISFNNNLVNKNEQTNNENNNIQEENNNIVDDNLLNHLYSIIGILPVDQYYKNDCLNVEISNNSYKDNAREIFSWYAELNSLNTYHYNENKCQSSEQCKIAYSCAACRSITKTDANKILKLYNFGNTLNNYFKEMPEYENEYSYSTNIKQPTSCEYFIEHKTNGKYINSTDIEIVDNQILKEFDFSETFERTDENLKTTKNQTVTYNFKKDTDGNYYLSNVEVK